MIRGHVEGHRVVGVEVAEGLEQGAFLDVSGNALELIVFAPEQDVVVEQPIEQLYRRVGHEAVHGERLGEVVGDAQIRDAELLGNGSQEHVFG